MVGTVRSFNPLKFGFITIEGGLEFFFLPSSVVGPSVRYGDEVDFLVTTDGGRNGELIAVEVTRREPSVASRDSRVKYD